MFRDLHHDAKLLMVSRGIRAFAFSYLNVVFAIYLDRLGYSTVTVGVIFSVAYISSALLTAVWGYLSDRFGRRTILMVLALLTIVSNAILIFFSSLFFILLAVIIANVGSGGSGGGGSGSGPFNPVEEALLAEKCTPETRNSVFSVNSFVGSVMGSLGALGSGLPQYLQESWGWAAVSSYKPLFLLTIIFSIILFWVYRSITEQHVPRKVQKKISKQTGVFVTKMSILGMIDNFGAGMAGALVSYWFFLRYGVEPQIPWSAVFSILLSGRALLPQRSPDRTAPGSGENHGLLPWAGVPDLFDYSICPEFCARGRAVRAPILLCLHGQSAARIVYYGHG